MGLNLSNRQIALEPGLDASGVQAMTEQLRRGLAARTPVVELRGEVEVDEVSVVAGHKGQPATVAKRGGSGAVAGWQARPLSASLTSHRLSAIRLRRSRRQSRRRAGSFAGRGPLAQDKPPILGLIQRGGQVVLRMLANVQQATIKPIIEAAVVEGTLVHTDEYGI